MNTPQKKPARCCNCHRARFVQDCFGHESSWLRRFPRRPIRDHPDKPPARESGVACIYCGKQMENKRTKTNLSRLPEATRSSLTSPNIGCVLNGKEKIIAREYLDGATLKHLSNSIACSFHPSRTEPSTPG